jgi:Lamin Tail Domain
VNEVADTAGIPNSPCPDDYIELYNDSPTNANISGWILRDDANNTYILPSNATLVSYGYLLFCKSQFLFGINGVDTITLYDASNVVRSTSGKLQNLGSTTLTYSRRPNGSFSYTKPSPNAVNIFLSSFTGTVFVNEVANSAVPGVCSGQDWIELINTGTTTVNLSGSILHDDNGPDGKDAFTCPSNFTLLPGEIRLLCGKYPGSFQFGINALDDITLIDSARDIISTTEKLLGLGTGALTYQRTSNNSYAYASPTPGTANFVGAAGVPIINEIAPAGTRFTDVCNGGQYIEILNGAFATLNLSGFVLIKGPTGPVNYTFPFDASIQGDAFAVFCRNQTYNFSINQNDTISILNTNGTIVSTSGPIGGSSPRPNAVDLTWARAVDLINPSAPFTPFYQYSVDPTSGKANVFSFNPVVLQRQSCGVQAAPFGAISTYQFKELLFLNVGLRNPELSGATFDPRTCNNLIIGDEGNLNEISVSNATANLLRTFPVIGGSTDTEGVCFWYGGGTGDKVAIIDERERSGK